LVGGKNVLSSEPRGFKEQQFRQQVGQWSDVATIVS
jgi:hypothetical protein